MSTWTETEAQVFESEAGLGVAEFESPFVAGPGGPGYHEAESPLGEHAGFGELEYAFASPFTPEAASAEGGMTETVAELVNELSSAELREALGELVQESAAVHAEQLAFGAGEAFGAETRLAEQAVRAHLEPVAQAAERMLEAMAAELGEREAGSLSEGELEHILETFEAMEVPAVEAPAFEYFFKALKRFAGRALRGAVNLAKKGFSALGRLIPLGLILRKLKSLVRPLLDRVLRYAIDRLPVALRPLAHQLKRRLGFEAPGEAELAEWAGVVGRPWAGSGAVLEAEVIAEVAHTLLSGAEAEAELGEHELGEYGAGELGAGEYGSAEFGVGESGSGEFGVGELGSGEYGSAEYGSAEFGLVHAGFEAEGLGESWSAVGAETAAEGEFGELSGSEIDRARVRLIAELAALREGESAAPAFERFLPAVLPILRIGVMAIGRTRVRNFIAKLLARPLTPYVGPLGAQALSRAIVDVGMRLATLEAPAAEAAHVGPAAVAAVVEDTARRLAELGAEAFEDAARLETETMAAFHEAVARNFPPSLVRADLGALEAGSRPGFWMLRPHGPYYKKYSRVLEITLTPPMARSITTFGGVSLDTVLKASRGFSKPIRVRVHLYEAVQGTSLARIAAFERPVPGMTRDGWRAMHPLTAHAAAVLGEPGLGRDVDAGYLHDRNHIAAGQRFFYLELPSAPGRRVVCNTPSQAFLTLDGRSGRNVAVAALYLSAAEAEAIAARARRGDTTAFVLALRAAFTAAVRSVTSSPSSRVRILKEGELSEAEGPLALLGGKILDTVIGKIVDVVMDALIRLATDYARLKRDHFVAAVDQHRCGVTVLFTFPVPGLHLILGGGFSGLRGLLGAFASRKLVPAMDTRPGLVRP